MRTTPVKSHTRKANFKDPSLQHALHQEAIRQHPQPQFVNVQIGKDDLLEHSDVEVKYLDHIYSYDQHDYLHGSNLSEKILTYLGEHNLITEDEINKMYKEGYTKTLKLPFNLLFSPEEKVAKRTQSRYDEDSK